MKAPALGLDARVGFELQPFAPDASEPRALSWAAKICDTLFAFRTIDEISSKGFR